MCHGLESPRNVYGFERTAGGRISFWDVVSATVFQWRFVSWMATGVLLNALYGGVDSMYTRVGARGDQDFRQRKCRGGGRPGT